MALGTQQIKSIPLTIFDAVVNQKIRFIGIVEALYQDLKELKIEVSRPSEVTPSDIDKGEWMCHLVSKRGFKILELHIDKNGNVYAELFSRCEIGQWREFKKLNHFNFLSVDQIQKNIPRIEKKMR